SGLMRQAAAGGAIAGFVAIASYSVFIVIRRRRTRVCVLDFARRYQPDRSLRCLACDSPLPRAFRHPRREALFVAPALRRGRIRLGQRPGMSLDDDARLPVAPESRRRPRSDVGTPDG